MNDNDFIQCRACGELKPITEFQIHPHSKTGRLSICKSCNGSRIAAGKTMSNSLTPPELHSSNPKFEGFTPRQLIAEMREIIAELKTRGYAYKGELTYTQRIKL